MMSPIIISKRLAVVTAVSFLFFLPAFSYAQDERLTNIRLDNDMPYFESGGVSRAELLERGCIPANVTKKRFTWRYSMSWPRGYVHVMPIDATLDPKENTFTTFQKARQLVACPPGVRHDGVSVDRSESGIDRQKRQAGISAAPPLPAWQQNIIYILNGIFITLAKVGLWLVGLASGILGPIVQFPRFITHPYVVTGWPFIQGIANLGFILALIFIAAITTLRLEIQGGVKRLLPRLLLAALLINFSLVIGGLLIDASRVLMAVVLNAMGVDDVNKMGVDILEAAKLPKGAVDKGTFKGSINATDSWDIPYAYAQSAILIWTMAVALGFAAILLLVRYIMLLLLLLISPVAYLALALPGASNVAKKWWSEFLKWVIYGPIILFLLAIFSIAGDAIEISGKDEVEIHMITIILSAVLFFIIANFALKMGGSGAAFAVGFATGQGRRVLSGGARAAYVGTGARAVTRSATRPVRTFVAERRRIRDRQERRREQQSWGTQAAQRRYGVTAEDRQRTAAATANIRANLVAGTPHLIEHQSLRDAGAARELTAEVRSNIVVDVVHSGDIGRSLAALSNIEMMRGMTPAQSAAVEQEVYTTNNHNLIRQLHDIQRQLRDETNPPRP